MIYAITDKCVKDNDGWILVSDLVPIAQKEYHIDFSKSGGPNKFLRNFEDFIEVKEQQNTSTGGKTSFLRIKKRKNMINYKWLSLMIISILILFSPFLIPTISDNQIFSRIFMGIGVLGSIASVLQFFSISWKKIKKGID